MDDEQINLHFQVIRQRMLLLQEGKAEAWQDIDAALEDLQVSYEEMQTSLENLNVSNQALLQQNQHITAGYSRYRNLFQSLPIACLVTNANGVILEANEAIARLLNVPQPYVVGKPLAAFVVQDDLLTFYAKLNQLSPQSETQHWQMRLSTWKGQPFEALLYVTMTPHHTGSIQALQIGVYNLSEIRKIVDQLPLEPKAEATQAEQMPPLQLPHSLDGLRVLVVDDEPDICGFISAVLESHGIDVRTVASATAALEELERFRPNVLLSDIRMPGGDGYTLIRQIRTLEAQKGGHLPAAAMTAYLDEDREKSLQAGFEAYLHKLAQPIEWVEIVTRLARQTANPDA